MKKSWRIWFCFLFLLWPIPALASGGIEISLAPATNNPAKPAMGDHLHFQSILVNKSGKPIRGLVAWISLVEVDKGNEQPVDLEDWSAHKAITGAALGPGESLKTDWPMRLIQGGDYRVMVSVTGRDDSTVVSSPTLEFHVKQKPVIQSGRVLPVAFGVPLLLFFAILWNTGTVWRQNKRSRGEWFAIGEKM